MQYTPIRIVGFLKAAIRWSTYLLYSSSSPVSE